MFAVTRHFSRQNVTDKHMMKKTVADAMSDEQHFGAAIQKEEDK